MRPQLLPMPASLRKVLPSAPSSKPCSRAVQCHRTVVVFSFDGSRLLHWLQRSSEMNLLTLSTNLWRGTNPPPGGLYNIILGKRRNKFHPRVSKSMFPCTRPCTTVLQANLTHERGDTLHDDGSTFENFFHFHFVQTLQSD